VEIHRTIIPTASAVQNLIRIWLSLLLMFPGKQHAIPTPILMMTSSKRVNSTGE